MKLEIQKANHNSPEHYQNKKPIGDNNISLNEVESNLEDIQHLSFLNHKQSKYSTPNRTIPNIDDEREMEIVKQLQNGGEGIEDNTIEKGVKDQKINESIKKIYHIDRQYLIPLFNLSSENKVSQIQQNYQSFTADQNVQTKQNEGSLHNIQSNQKNNYFNTAPNLDDISQISQMKDVFKNNLQKIQSNVITLNPFQSNTNSNQNSDSKQENNKIDEDNNEHEISSIKKLSQQNPNSPQIITQFNSNNNYNININNDIFNQPLSLNMVQIQYPNSPNQEIVDQMCETEINNIKVVGSIYMMLICLLAQFGQVNLAQSLYFRFQKEIMVVESGQEMFDVDLFTYIENNLSSVIYLNELVVLSLRVMEFIPLLNLFLIVFQVRIHKIRKQIISAMTKKSLSTLEILIGNYKKRMPKRKSKRKMGNSKIRRAMDLITIQYMKKGQIENEHDLLLFFIDEGFQQTSVELLMFYVTTKLIPPELFITKKVAKSSLVELNIPIFAKAFRYRSKWMKSLFLTEKFFLHICQLLRQNETFAEGLYFMKKISQKKQRSSAPLWYTENVIEIFEEVAQKQAQYQMLQVYTLNPLITSLIISKMLYKLCLNKNPLQVQLNRLADFYKALAVDFRDQITDERQMKMTLFKISFPSDKTLVQICKSKVIYTYFNDFLQSELILKLLTQKYESSTHFDMNLLASSTSFNYILGKKQLKTPYLHYNQKFEKVVEENDKPLASMPLFNFNISNQDCDQKKADKQFFGHLMKQKLKVIGSSLFKFRQMGNNNSLQQSSNLGMTSLVKQYRAAIKKKKTIQFNNEQTSVKYPNQNNDNSKNQNMKGGSTLNIFKEITPVNYSFVSKNNHFYQFNIYKKSLKIRSYLEMILYFVIFGYCMSEFFKILDLTVNFQQMDIQFLDLMFNTPSKQLIAEVQQAYQTYVPTYTLEDILIYSSTDVSKYCQLAITLVTGGIQKYITEWQDDCIRYVKYSPKANTITDNFDRSVYFIYMIPFAFLFKVLHAKITRKKIIYDVTEYVDILLVYLCIQHYFVNQQMKEFTQNTATKTEPQAAEMVRVLDVLVTVLTIIQFCLFIKVFQFLSRTEKLGVFMKILNLTIRQVFSFMFIFMLNIFAFASLFFLLSSYRLPLYNTFQNSIRTLIATSLGTFDYQDMNLAESIIQTVFLYSSNVIMLNLLVAILTKTYSDINERSNVEYSLILYEEYALGKFDKNYSLLIAFPPPITIFSGIFSWVLFFQKLKDFNGFFVKLGYTFILIIVFVIYFVINIFLTPIAWIKMMYSISKYQIQSIGLNIILQKRKNGVQDTQSWRQSYGWCFLAQLVLLLFKLLQWVILGLPYLLIIAIFSDSYQFLKSAYNGVENKYYYKTNQMHTPTPLRGYFLIKCQPQLIDPRFKSDSSISNFQLVSGYLKFKFLMKESRKQKELEKINGEKSPVLKNYFLKVLKQAQRRKKLFKQFQISFEQEYQKQKEVSDDLIANEHTDESFLAIIRTKQIYYSTEFWDKNKVNSYRQMKFYNIAINPSKKHQIHVQQSLIKKVQSQSANISNIRNIQKQMSSANPQPSSNHSLGKNNNKLIFHKQPTQRKKLQTLYEQSDAE